VRKAAIIWYPLMKILVVEDQRRLGLFLKKNLSQHGYTTMWVQTCEAAGDAICENRYDVIILDLGLPDGSGLQLLREWRRDGFQEVVLILSARDAVQDRVEGLDLGADDYLAKPFNLTELLARVRSLVRRQATVKKTILEHRGIKLDLISRSANLKGKPVELTSREFAVLEAFMQNPGRILTRTLICEKVWESHMDADANLLDVYMSKLRTKLESSLGQTARKQESTHTGQGDHNGVGAVERLGDPRGDDRQEHEQQGALGTRHQAHFFELEPCKRPCMFGILHLWRAQVMDEPGDQSKGAKAWRTCCQCPVRPRQIDARNLVGKLGDERIGYHAG
jgi:DNA-binding response OmpR family regulator